MKNNFKITFFHKDVEIIYFTVMIQDSSNNHSIPGFIKLPTFKNPVESITLLKVLIKSTFILYLDSEIIKNPNLAFVVLSKIAVEKTQDFFHETLSNEYLLNNIDLRLKLIVKYSDITKFDKDEPRFVKTSDLKYYQSLYKELKCFVEYFQ